MSKFLIGTFLILLLVPTTLAQDLKRFYDRIDLTIAKDARYTNLCSVKFKQEEFGLRLLTGARGSIALTSDAASESIDSSSGTVRRQTVSQFYDYELLYIQDTLNSFVPVQLTERTTTTAERSLEGKIRTEQQEPVVRKLFDLRDFFSLRGNDRRTYEHVVAFIAARNTDNNLLYRGTRVRPQAIRAPVERVNQDYRIHAKYNDVLPFGKPVNETYSVDLSFSGASFSHRLFTEDYSLGIRSFGFEAGFGDRILNLLSYQSPYLSWGARFLVGFGGQSSSLDTNFFVDVKILGRSSLDTRKLIEQLNLNRSEPLMVLDPPLLNVSSGAAFEISTARPFNNSRLPFLTLYYAGGPKVFRKPSKTFGPDKNSYAFFSTIQWESSMSFYWELGESGYNHLRMDLGAGTYNIWRVSYDSTGHMTSAVTLQYLSSVQPLIALDYTHGSDVTIFGSHLRFFDNRFTFGPWLKIFKKYSHEVRLEFTAVTQPIGRSVRDWETHQGILMQLRYRYGL